MLFYIDFRVAVDYGELLAAAFVLGNLENLPWMTAPGPYSCHQLEAHDIIVQWVECA